jgi:o-succinylbenzoate synthase
MVRYLVPLKRAMRVAGRLVTARSGVLVALLGDEGACGVGDVAPLPGLHAEALSHCVQEVCQWSARRLRRAGDELSANDPHVSVSDVIEGDGWLGPESPSLSPSTRSALSAALAQCVAMVNGMDVDDFLCAAHGRYEPCERRIAYNGVAPRPPGAAGGGDVARERAHSALLAAGCARVLKLKVGHTGSVDDDAAAVALLVASLRDSDCLLRIDANCSWSAEQFSLFCAQTRACGDVIEYVEEPIAVKTPEEMVRFCHDVYGDDGCCGRPPLGLDESLVQFSLSETVSLAVAPGVGAIVLKPSVQGDLCRMFRLARVAESRDVKVILSSVFDSGVGLAWAAVLASAIGHPRSASHGIGTFTSLARDAVSPSFEEFCVSRSDAKIRVSDCKQLLTREARAVLKEGCNPAHLEDSLRGMPEHTRR